MNSDCTDIVHNHTQTVTTLEDGTAFIRQVFSGALLLAKGVGGLVGFLGRHPTKLPASFQFIVRILPKYLPQKMRSSVQVHEKRLQIRQQLLQCSSIFEEIQDQLAPLSIRSLQENAPKAASHWLVLYLLIRTLKPKVVVETGVAAGESTSYVLQALSDNGKGVLYSIDMPVQWYVTPKGSLWVDVLPIGAQPGYLIPDELRDRWKLVLGRSSEKLPALLENLGEIDLFLHDSEHTYDNMTFEFNCAWTHIRPGGFLATDDPTWEGGSAFLDFARSVGTEFVIIKQMVLKDTELAEIGLIHKA